MSVSQRAKIVVCCALSLAAPLAMGDDAPGAMVYGKGTVSVNGSPLPNSSAIFAGDAVQTMSDGAATINAEGSNLILQPSSLIKLESNGVLLDHGSLSVATSKAMVAHAINTSATPTSTEWTEFEISQSNGNVDVVARKGELAVNCGKEQTTLSPGQEITSDGSGKCRKRKKSAGAYPPAQGNILDSPYLKYIAAAAGGGVLIWVLLPKGNQPASPSIP